MMLRVKRVSSMRRTSSDDRAPVCPRCGTVMQNVVTVAPVGSQPGMIAYECPACRVVTSVPLPPETQQHS
jgi:hypothetical protein